MARRELQWCSFAAGIVAGIVGSNIASVFFVIVRSIIQECAEQNPVTTEEVLLI